jgi:hypothetical protein
MVQRMPIPFPKQRYILAKLITLVLDSLERRTDFEGVFVKACPVQLGRLIVDEGQTSRNTYRYSV